MKVFKDTAVVSESEFKEVIAAITNILAENKKGVESLNTETKGQLEQVLAYISEQYDKPLKAIQSDLTKTKAQVETATKAQHERAFKRLQTLISAIKMPKDGAVGPQGPVGLRGEKGEPGSPDTAPQIVDKLESLKGEARLDASAIKNLEKFLKKVVTKSKEVMVGGIRFFEQLADVSILTANKRQDMIAQYDTTNNRWQDGVAITVSTTAPTNPKLNDIWIDIS